MAPIEFHPVEVGEHLRWNPFLERLGESIGELERPNLHYTGGTKAMAVRTHAWWRQKWGETGAKASYLGPDSHLYYDDAADGVPVDVSLSLDEQCRLHFGSKPECKDEHEDATRVAWAGSMRKLLQEKGVKPLQQLLPPIYGLKTRVCHPELGDLYLASYGAADEKNFKDKGPLTRYDLTVLCSKLNGAGQHLDDLLRARSETKIDKVSRLKLAKWLHGHWLEVWLADQLALMKDGEKPFFEEVHQGVEVGDFEMDVIAVRGHRLYLFSCTTAHNSCLVKPKLMEALHRAGRIGGEHARAAVVCFHDTPTDVLKTVKEERWEGYNTLRIFGLTHVVGGQEACNGEFHRNSGGVEEFRAEQNPVTLEEGVRKWAR